MRRGILRLSILTACLINSVAHAETKRVPLSGRVITLRTSRGLGKVLVKSKGAVSHPFTLVIRGPKGLRSTTWVEGPSGKIWEVQTEPTSDVQKRCAEVKPEEMEELPIPTPPSDDPTAVWTMPPDFDSARCQQYSQGTLDQTRPFLEQAYRRVFNDLEVCAYLSANGVREEDFQQNFGTKAKTRSLTERKGSKVLRLSGILHKDACSGDERDEYTLRILLTLPKGEPDQKLSVQVRAKALKGRPATIKPVSDGRFAPQPLILMQWLNSPCGASIAAVKWAEGMPISETILPVEDYIPYKNLTLARAPLASLLNGGKGTFSLTNTVRGYGACFDFTPTRQRQNGYPG